MVLFSPSSQSPIDILGIAGLLDVGDFNNDSLQDIAVISGSNANRISIFLGNGTGNFGNAVLSVDIELPVFNRLDLADFNLDGNLDIVVTTDPLFDDDGNFTNYSIFLGQGNGNFNSPIDYRIGGVTQDVTTGDFNLDGVTDLAFALNTLGGKIGLGLGDGNGGFIVLDDDILVSNALSGFGINPNKIVSLDANNDGFLDLAVTFEGREESEGLAIFIANNPALVNSSQNSNNPVSYFNEPTIYRTGNPTFLLPYDLAVGDFNNDSNQDLVVVGAARTENDDGISILFGDGNGDFSNSINISAQSRIQPLFVDVADFNNDGNVDLVIRSYAAPNDLDSDIVFLGNGTGNFEESYRVREERFGFFNNVKAADFNVDGQLDIVSGLTDLFDVNTITAFLNTDILQGTSLSDNIIGSSENDILEGLAGNDTIIGNKGNDTINGGQGADFLEGGNDNDFLLGFGNNDTINGGQGQDTVNAGGGNDIVFGAAGRDILNGSIGNDLLNGGGARDIIIGSRGNDRLIGGTELDILNGADNINFGVNERDTLTGGRGTQDRFKLGETTGSYYLDEGAGGTSSARILDFESLDRIILTGSSSNYRIANNGGDSFILKIEPGTDDTVGIVKNTVGLNLGGVQFIYI